MLILAATVDIPLNLPVGEYFRQLGARGFRARMHRGRLWLERVR